MASSSLKSLAVPVGIEPMEAKLVAELPEEPGWQFEPKWDGFRCLAFRAGDQVDLRAKSGKPLARYFPEVVAMLCDLKPSRFVLDGELAIPVGDTLSFDALQMRIHPAESRIKKLAVETPAILILFDMLLDARRQQPDRGPAGRSAAPHSKRFYKTAGQTDGMKLSPCTREPQAGRAMARQRRAALSTASSPSGATAPISPASAPCSRSSDCARPTAWSAASATQPAAARSARCCSVSTTMTASCDHVGFTATITDAERPALTKRLEALIAPPGFTGKAPGGPSRWSTERIGEWEPVKPKLVVEVRYDHVTGDRFRHGTKLVRFRPDKAPQQCTFEQIAPQTLPRNVKLLLG